MPVFADSNIVVYLIEQPPDWGPRAAGYIDAVLASGDRIVVSELVRMECRIRPLATGDTATLAAFERFFVSQRVDLVGISRAVCDRAAVIRAQHRIRPLDALHLAAAIENGCTRFVTHDRRLAAFPDVAVDLLS